MRTSERNSMRRRVRRARRQSFIAGAMTMILILIAAFGIGSVYASAQNSDEAPAEIKYYKSVQIQEGDSLWSIAKEYMNDDYESVYDYMAELVTLNQLEEHEVDHLQEGDYLTVAYFAEAAE